MSEILAHFLNPDNPSPSKLNRIRPSRPTLADFLEAHPVNARQALVRHAEAAARQQGRVVPFNSNPQIHRQHRGGDRQRVA